MSTGNGERNGEFCIPPGWLKVPVWPNTVINSLSGNHAYLQRLYILAKSGDALQRLGR